MSLSSYDVVFFFKQKTAYEMRISDWSSDVCSSDLPLKNLSRKGKFVSAAVLLAACGGSIALAQNVDGLDIQHILSRGEAADPDAEALIREVARRGDEMRADARERSEEHTSELQSLMRISYAVFCLKKKNKYKNRRKR